jgi:hypothetical protein
MLLGNSPHLELLLSNNKTPPLPKPYGQIPPYVLQINNLLYNDHKAAHLLNQLKTTRPSSAQAVKHIDLGVVETVLLDLHKVRPMDKECQRSFHL